MNLENKVVVITGATNGLGKSLVKEFLSKGSLVVASSNVVQDLELTQNDLKVDVFFCDVKNEIEINNLAKFTTDKYGKIDIWINNAGVLAEFPKDELLDKQKAHDLFDVNFFGTLLGCRVASKFMKQNHEALIISILSSAAMDATRAGKYEIYAASKWATRGFLQSFNNEILGTNIKTLSVYPGGIKTSLYGENKPDSYDQYMEPENVAGKIVEHVLLNNFDNELIIKRPSV